MSGTDKKILIVDDDPDYLMAMTALLTAKGFGNTIVPLNNGTEVLEYLFPDKEENEIPVILPALVLLDIKMPKIDGLQVLAILRDIEKTRNLPVFIVTSSELDTDLKTAMKLGANGYLTKPVDPDSLVKLFSGYL
ncbi:MAG: response regulator [Bacteroidetes bacterium]|nr:response regulator [Bacteroidota bacterium]